MPSQDDGRRQLDALARRLARLLAMAESEAALHRARSVQGPEILSDAATVLLQKLGHARMASDVSDMGPHDRRVVQNVARKRRRAERTWTRHHRALTSVAEPGAVAVSPCDAADELKHLAAPLRAVAELARRALAPEEMARRLEITEYEVGRRAFWILVRHTERGAALPEELGLRPGSLAGLPPELRFRALRCLCAIRCDRRVLARECGKSVSALQKDLERAGIAKRRV